MDAIKIEREDGVFYFTTQEHCSKFLETTMSQIAYSLKKHGLYRRFQFTVLDNVDDILPAYINVDTRGLTVTKYEAEQRNRQKDFLEAVMKFSEMLKNDEMINKDMTKEV